MISDFSGSIALLLGGNCELALETASLMIQLNFFPVLTYRSSKGLQDIRMQLSRYGNAYTVYECDLNRQKTIRTMFSRLDKNFDFLVDFSHGHLESLVASADSDLVNAYFMENIAARAEVIKTASRLMLKKKRGRFVYISSTAAQTSNPGQGFYAAAKLASEALYRNTGIELESRGITSRILRPGYIDSGRGRQFLGKSNKRYRDKIERYGVLSCREVAESILELLTDDTEKNNAGIFEINGTKGLRSIYDHIVKH